MIKYMTRRNNYGAEYIQAIEVERETDLSIWVDGNRSAKISDYCRYHNTWSDAWLFLLNREEKKRNSIKDSLERAEIELHKIQELKQPLPINRG